MKSIVFCGVTACSSENVRRYVELMPPCSGSRSKPSKKAAETGGKLFPSASAAFIAGLLLESEDGDNMFPRSTWCYNPEYRNLSSHCCEDLRSDLLAFLLFRTQAASTALCLFNHKPCQGNCDSFPFCRSVPLECIFPLLFNSSQLLQIWKLHF
jgi:hypothetical protein